MDKPSPGSTECRDGPGEVPFDQWLKIWFQQLLDEPPPNRRMDLLDRLADEGGA